MRGKPKAAWAAALAAAATLIALVAALLGGAAASAQAGPQEDAVLDWNRHAINALFNGASATPPGAGQTPPVGTLHLAMVHGAVYDAVNMIDGGHEPYLAGLPAAPATASKSAAVATAAHHVLVGLGGEQDGDLVPPLPATVIAWLDAEYAALGIPAGDPGAAAGAAAAQAMLDAREDDRRYVPFTWTSGLDPGEWRPTPAIDLFAWVGRVEPFLLNSTSQFRTKGPDKLTSGAYRREYNEVKALGGNGTTTPSARTDEQTDLARFYTVNPVELFNRTFRGISADEGLTLVEQARFFAMLSLAGADSFINCWDDKEFWSFWRPITAIQSGNADTNDKTVGDPNWMSFIPAPPYPDHPSGYNCITSSSMYTAKAFFGNRMEFDLTATVNPPVVPSQVIMTRHYDRFTDVVDDTIDARVYQGIHFRSADVQAAGIGKNVARWLDKHFLEPVNDDDDDDDDEEDD